MLGGLAGVALLALPAGAQGAGTFGLDLSSPIFPDNSVPAHDCGNPAKSCTRVGVEYPDGAASGNIKAPKDGTIDTLKLIAGGSGSFKFQLAKRKGNGNKAKVTRNGPKINYTGQPKRGAIIETFNVDVHVKKGEYLAIKAKKTSVLRCNSGGTRQLLFQPALVPGDPFKTADDDDGCELMLEAIYE